MEEPKRKSFLDVLRQQLQLADSFAYITRFVYLGGYEGSADDLLQKIETNVKALNEEYGEIVVTGLLLVYPKHFIHMMEASEETIYRHFKEVFADSSNEIFGRIIFLPAYHNIYKMYFHEWHNAFVPNPPVTLTNIQSIELGQLHRQIKHCLIKVNSLCEYLMGVNAKSLAKFYEILKSLDKVLPLYLPEITLVEYLLSAQSVVLEDLRDYLRKFNEIPFMNFYNDKVWPPPYSLLPRPAQVLDETPPVEAAHNLDQDEFLMEMVNT